MNSNYPFLEIQKILTPAQNPLVAIGLNSGFDQVAAALALFLSLKKTGKKASVLSPEEMRVEFSHLVGVDKVGGRLTEGDLILSFPVEKIDKISSNENEAAGKLDLVIRLKTGVPALKKEEVIFSFGSGQVDLIFTVGVQKLDDLGKVYQENMNLFKEKTVVNIDNQPQNSQYGRINLTNPETSCSEIVISLIKNLRLPIDQDISGNLFLGLRQATQNFQKSSITAETFEAAAFCMKAGAKLDLNVPVAPSPDWLEPKIYKGSILP